MTWAGGSTQTIAVQVETKYPNRLVGRRLSTRSSSAMGELPSLPAGLTPAHDLLEEDGQRLIGL
jgi:hypothetical protein